MKATQLKAVVGLHKISDFRRDTLGKNNQGSYEIAIKNIIVHPGYDCSRTANDIAMLELSRTINFSDYVSPICIAEGDLLYTGTSATVSGWGWTNEDQQIGQRADILQKASVEIWNNAKCQESFNIHDKRHTIGKTQLCAGKKIGGIDSCWVGHELNEWNLSFMIQSFLV